MGTQPDVVIVDYGVGNIGSLSNMLAKAGKTAQLSSDPDEIENAARIILPGVGAFDHAALKLRESGLAEPLVVAARDRGTPLLGVCLGMQLLLDHSEEGVEPGLGLIPGRVVRFPSEFEGAKLAVPHMGWNTLEMKKKTDRVPELGQGDRYYFVHSFFAEPAAPSDTLATTTYGITFASALQRGNVLAAQFHPEKSHRFGLKFLAEFAQS